MTKLSKILLTAALLLLFATGAQAGDASQGRVLAGKWCAECHIVSENQQRASDAAPTFAAIAKDPTKTSASLTAWLTDPHPPMVKVELTKRQIDDLVTYIGTLKTR